MRTHILRATLTALTLLALSACSGTSSTAPSTPSPSASTSASASSSASTSGSSEAATSEAAAPSTDASTDASAPADTATLSFDAISIDITDARQAELSQPAGRTLAGTAGVQVNLKIANTSNQAIDAAPLSFPTLKLDDGTEVTGFALTSDGAETTYGIIEPGKSQELTLFFPTDQAPSVLSITLLNPLEPTQTLTVQTDF
ncbi:hypothetical protein [Rothia nasimurium]|uniref:hypothetical protein n=1 Tax=Rothia nasimurium TaxID=85336 RepID=UPI003B9F1EF5